MQRHIDLVLCYRNVLGGRPRDLHEDISLSVTSCHKVHLIKVALSNHQRQRQCPRNTSPNETPQIVQGELKQDMLYCIWHNITPRQTVFTLLIPAMCQTEEVGTLVVELSASTLVSVFLITSVHCAFIYKSLDKTKPLEWDIIRTTHVFAHRKLTYGCCP